MAISLTRYIDITSGVGGSQVVALRDLVGRLFSDNDMIPPGTFLSFTDAADVASYFGSASEEYARASFYFSWVSKNITSPQSIQFARWVDTAVASMIFGQVKPQTLATYQAISDATMVITVGSVVATVNSDLTGTTSFSDIAGAITADLNANYSGTFATCSVSYDSTRGAFDFVGGTTDDGIISVAPSGTGTDISGLFGWLPQAINTNGTVTPGAIWCNGAAVETLTNMLNASINLSNNFGSFLFMPALDVTQITEVANWNKLQNVMFMYTVPSASADASTYYTALAAIGGVGVTISDTAGQYPEMAPMMILAATQYTSVNSVQNYMFQIFPGLTPSVTTDTVASGFDTISTNYYGQTQSAGQFINFYQRGVLMGTSTDPLDMNVYSNEIWLKDAAGAAIMNLLLSLPQIPANASGRIQILSSLQSTIGQALNNGVISVGKLLTNTQQLFIAQVTGDPQAWHQVQNNGYWVDCQIVLVNTDYIAEYTLVYSKDDIIRKVTGSHVLI